MRNRAFALVELLLVIAIIAILIGLFLGAASWARRHAQETAFISNLRQVGLAVLNYESARGSFPLATTWTETQGNYVPRSTWIADILPYLEQEQLFASIDQSLPIDEQPAAVTKALLPAFLYPSQAYPAPGRTNITALALLAATVTDQAVIEAGDLVPMNYVLAPTNPDNPGQDYSTVIHLGRYCDAAGWHVPPATTYQQIVRGTSNTAMLSGSGLQPAVVVDPRYPAQLKGSWLNPYLGGAGSTAGLGTERQGLPIADLQISWQSGGGLSVVNADGSVVGVGRVSAANAARWVNSVRLE